MTRLAENDVMAIISSVTNNTQPPGNLKFNIICIPQNNRNELLPPPYQFHDGIYILLRCPPQKVPSKLADTLLADSDLGSLSGCSWSGSGPQLKNSVVQLRYVYPKGSDGEYNNSKGATMRTIISKDGIEDMGIRIFHVYHSRKRGAWKIAVANKPSTNQATALTQLNSPPKKKRSNKDVTTMAVDIAITEGNGHGKGVRHRM